MNWKETVMNRTERRKAMERAILKNPFLTYPTPQERESVLLPAQAEITWDKAVREMVEWMIKYRSESTGQFICFTLFKEQWQAKLKASEEVIARLSE